MNIKKKTILVVRFFCLGIMFLYFIFRFSIPLVTNKPIYMDENDGYILITSVVTWLLAEVIYGALTRAIKVFFSNLANKFKIK